MHTYTHTYTPVSASVLAAAKRGESRGGGRKSTHWDDPSSSSGGGGGGNSSESEDLRAAARRRHPTLRLASPNQDTPETMRAEAAQQRRLEAQFEAARRRGERPSSAVASPQADAEAMAGVLGVSSVGAVHARRRADSKARKPALRSEIAGLREVDLMGRGSPLPGVGGSPSGASGSVSGKSGSGGVSGKSGGGGGGDSGLGGGRLNSDRSDSSLEINFNTQYVGEYMWVVCLDCVFMYVRLCVPVAFEERDVERVRADAHARPPTHSQHSTLALAGSVPMSSISLGSSSPTSYSPPAVRSRPITKERLARLPGQMRYSSTRPRTAMQ